VFYSVPDGNRVCVVAICHDSSIFDRFGQKVSGPEDGLLFKRVSSSKPEIGPASVYDQPALRIQYSRSSLDAHQDRARIRYFKRPQSVLYRHFAVRAKTYSTIEPSSSSPFESTEKPIRRMGVDCSFRVEECGVDGSVLSPHD
jgi:hypothetical protein